MQPRDVSDQRARMSARRARAGQHVYMQYWLAWVGVGESRARVLRVGVREIFTWVLGLKRTVSNPQ